LSSVRTVRRRRRPAAIKNGSQVEHDTDPCARSSAPILSLRASPTLDRQHISAAYAGWACFCVHAGKGTSHHADSWDQAQTSRLRRACSGKISQVQIFLVGRSAFRAREVSWRSSGPRAFARAACRVFRPIPPASARGRPYAGYAGSCARPCSRRLSCASVSGYSPPEPSPGHGQSRMPPTAGVASDVGFLSLVHLA
jgi:hypothetical protein